MEKRVVYSDNGTLSDYSVELNNYHSGTGSISSLVADQDYLYFGSRQPFNSIFVKMDTVNSNNSTISVDYWDGDQWRSTVDVLDETSGLSQSGHITWFTDLDYSWTREHTNHGADSITGLTDVVIYSKYWVRLSFSNDLSADTSISFVGDLFCNDDDLESEFPDFALSSTKTAYESGKTSWEEQRVIASRILVNDLISKGIIKDSGQILNRSDYTAACVQKTAEIIFNSFGEEFNDPKQKARNEYRSRLTKRVHRVDLNKNANEDPVESTNETGFLNR